MKKYLLMVSLLAAFAAPASAGGLFLFGDVGGSSRSKYGVTNDYDTYAVGGGFRLDNNIALEFAYRDLGSLVEGDRYAHYQEDVSALQVSAIFSLPLSQEFSLFGRLGIAELSVDWEDSDFVYPGYESGYESQNKMVYGFGANFDLSRDFSLRAEYNEYDYFRDLKIKTFTVGAVFSF